MREWLADWMTQDPRFKLLAVVCLSLWLGLLSFGLWPFDFFPKNKVQWLHNQNGLHFDRYGQVYSPAPWDLNSSSVPANNGSLSVEIWLRSWEKVYPQVSAIFSVENPASQGNFVIAQSGSDLFVGGQFRDKSDRIGARKLWLAEACRNAEPRFITLTSGPEGTTLYLEGVFQHRYPIALTRENFSGRLLLGHPAAGHQAWTGDLFGLAIYDHALTMEDVGKHYKAWQRCKNRGHDHGARSFCVLSIRRTQLAPSFTIVLVQHPTL